MNRYRLLFILFAFLSLAGLTSCFPEQQIANRFIRTPGLITLKVAPPTYVLKFSHKGETIRDFATLDTAAQDSALWATSRYIRSVSDSIVLETYMNAFISGLRDLGFKVYLEGLADSFPADGPQSYLVDIPQIQLDEYLYTLEDEGEFMDTLYQKRIVLNAIDFSTWVELGKASGTLRRKTVLYSSMTGYDGFDGRFYNDPFTGMVRYKYSIDTLTVDDVHDLAGYAGRQHAGYLYDFFLNQYIIRHLPEGMEPFDYYRYNPKRKSIYPAEDERFEVLQER